MLLGQYLAALRQQAAGPGDVPLLQVPAAGLQQGLARVQPAGGRMSDARKHDKTNLNSDLRAVVSVDVISGDVVLVLVLVVVLLEVELGELGSMKTL